MDQQGVLLALLELPYVFSGILLHLRPLKPWVIAQCANERPPKWLLHTPLCSSAKSSLTFSGRKHKGFLFLFFGFQCPSCELLLVLLMAEVFVPILIPNFTPIYISFSLSFTFFDYSKRSLSFRKWNFVTTWNLTTVTARYANLNRELSMLFLLKKEKEKINFILV